MRLVMAALVASTGCAQLFGIDETSGLDANTDLATVQVQRVSVGASVVRTPQDLSAQTATFYQDDGAGGFTPVPGTLAGTAMDSFTADVPGTPPVQFTLPDTINPGRMWALPARVQRGNFTVFEHPSPQMPVDTSQVGVAVTLPTPYVTGQNFVIQAIGAWSQYGLLPANLPAPDLAGSTAINTTIPYTSFTSMIATPKTRITIADVVLLLRYVGNQLTGVFQSQFDQTDGTDMMTGAMTAVTANDSLMANITPTDYATRFTAVRPAVTGLAMSWRVMAAPGWSIASDQGVRLHAGSAMQADTMVMPTFGNPFESLDWRTVFTFSTSSSRSFSFTENAMTVSVPLAAGLSSSVAPTPATPITVNMPAGLPTTIRANLTMLATDGMALTVDPTKPVAVEVLVDRPSNSLYQLQVIELGVMTDGANMPTLTRTYKLDAVTTGSGTGTVTFNVPAELFTVGKSYYFHVRVYQGAFTEAATGDLQTVSLPFSVGHLDSAVFTVGMP